ncbi:hypothetical protein ABKV19_021600 [Rosa sericea]
MAAPKFFFFVALITLSLLFISASCSFVVDHGINVPSALESEKDILPSSDDKKVNLTLYYFEPRFCSFPTHTNQSNNAILCQNGPDECYLNTIQACGIDVSVELWTSINSLL